MASLGGAATLSLLARLALPLILAAFAVAPASAAAAIPFAPCTEEGHFWECGSVTVPLDHSGGVAGTVRLHVERVRAEAGSHRGVVLALAGGPGQGATTLAETFNRELGRGARDLIVMDQRGTGRSGPLRCEALERTQPRSAAEEAAACAEWLGPRRAFYTTRDSIADIEALRRELGVERLSIYGVSYGSKVALAYAAAYPDRVERLVLDSVVDLDGPDPLYRTTFAAIPRVLRAICRRACARFTDDPARDLERLVDRVRKRRLSGRWYDGRGRRRSVRITRIDLLDQILVGDFVPSLRAEVPAAVRAALAGDAAPLARLVARLRPTGDEPVPAVREMSQTLYTATTCEETAFPWARTATPPEREAQARAHAEDSPASAFAPFDRTTALATDALRLCSRWPAAAEAPVLAAGPLPDVPVLVLNGEDDVRTTVEVAREVAGRFPRATVITDAVGHHLLGSNACARRAVGAFFAGRAQRPCRTARVYRPLAPPPRRVGAVGALRAAVLTLEDFLWTHAVTGASRAGGLRGGSYRAGASGARLRGYSYVPGLRVSGRFADLPALRGRFRVRGAAAGTLAVRGTRVTGRLDGDRVSARLRRPPTGF